MVNINHRWNIRVRILDKFQLLSSLGYRLIDLLWYIKSFYSIHGIYCFVGIKFYLIIIIINYLNQYPYLLLIITLVHFFSRLTFLCHVIPEKILPFYFICFFQTFEIIFAFSAIIHFVIYVERVKWKKNMFAGLFIDWFSSILPLLHTFCQIQLISSHTHTHIYISLF